MKIIKRSQELRTVKLQKIGEHLIKIGINANIMTAISLMSGIISVYFLFNNYILFFLFATLHLIADGLDGVIARISEETNFGKYFDYISDRFIAFLILIKLGWFLQDYYVYIITGLFLIANIVYFISRFKAPILFIRSTALGVLAVATHPWFPYTESLLILGYLTAGAVMVYSLAKQLQWFMKIS
ncbi:MAG: CDP-alcohol phosphatidyltransferase family protein [Nanoarchaeota archaeon]|nr:CDP-alcohol phosphatidyltransferase family protein [Nanoarchaeota archaeon]MBU1632589.1 CDP-alcohol phosphatidyltransferase family protein [Nanoarchaeota archaeon]MBU1876519.1 CDP-alcohol phosphatidyltransferase family protein [Nanoarchaeota archaeon]